MADDALSPEGSKSALDSADWGREVVPPAEAPPPETPPAEVVAEPSVDEAQALARSRGWVPKEEWRGSEDRWVDPTAFNERYEKTLPLRLDKENRKLAQALKDAESRIADLTKKTGEWEKFQAEQAQAREKLRHDQLVMERKVAIDNNDTEALVRIDDELLDLKIAQRTSKPTGQQVTAQQVDPVVKRTLEDFVRDNPIFTDPKMGQVLSEQATLMRASGSTIVGRDFLDEAKDRVMRMYPERFRSGSEVPARRHPLGETGGAPTGGRTSPSRTWNDLKPEYREALDRFIATTPGATRENIIKNAGEEAFRK